MSLFDHSLRVQLERESPLAHRMRPRTLDEYVGQEHIIGPGRLLRRAIQADQLSSILFCGPPGTGKTTLASVIAHQTKSHFVTINAVLAGVKEIRASTRGGALPAVAGPIAIGSGRTTLRFQAVDYAGNVEPDYSPLGYRKVTGVAIVDAADPTSPSEIAFVGTPGSAYGVAVDGIRQRYRALVEGA